MRVASFACIGLTAFAAAGAEYSTAPTDSQPTGWTLQIAQRPPLCAQQSASDGSETISPRCVDTSPAPSTWPIQDGDRIVVHGSDTRLPGDGWLHTREFSLPLAAPELRGEASAITIDIRLAERQQGSHVTLIVSQSGGRFSVTPDAGEWTELPLSEPLPDALSAPRTRLFARVLAPVQPNPR